MGGRSGGDPARRRSRVRGPAARRRGRGGAAPDAAVVSLPRRREERASGKLRRRGSRGGDPGRRRLRARAGRAGAGAPGRLGEVVAGVPTRSTARRPSCPGAPSRRARLLAGRGLGRYLGTCATPGTDARARRAALRSSARRIVLTVPASFDEEARELTVAAARRRASTSDLSRSRWRPSTPGSRPIAGARARRSGRRARARLRRRRRHDGLHPDPRRTSRATSRFERIAIGEHLLLGGDNVDLALAARVEERLGARLTLRSGTRCGGSAARRRSGCSPTRRRAACGDLLGSGRAVVGGALSAELTREEVVGPARGRVPAGEGQRRVPAATPAWRAARARAAVRHRPRDHKASRPVSDTRGTAGGTPGRVRRHARRLLFNGGFFTPDARASVSSRRGRVEGGCGRGSCPASARSRRWRSAPRTTARSAARPEAMRRARQRRQPARLLPRRQGGGPDRGRSRLPCCRAGRRRARTSTSPGASSPCSPTAPCPSPSTARSPQRRRGCGHARPRDDLHRHAPLVTVLRYGKRSRQAESGASVVRFTELGTLELWCSPRETEHRWRLQFQLRGRPRWQPEPGSAGPRRSDGPKRRSRGPRGCPRRLRRARDPDGEPRALGAQIERSSATARTPGRSCCCGASPIACCGCQTHAGAGTGSRHAGSTCSASACARASAPPPTTGGRRDAQGLHEGARLSEGRAVPGRVAHSLAAGGGGLERRPAAGTRLARVGRSGSAGASRRG